MPPSQYVRPRRGTGLAQLPIPAGIPPRHTCLDWVWARGILGLCLILIDSCTMRGQMLMRMMVSSPDIVARVLALGDDRAMRAGGSWELEGDRAKMHYQRRSTAGAAAWVGACCGWTACAAG